MQHVLTSMNEVISNQYDSSHKALDIVSSDRKETDIVSLEDGTVETVVNNTLGPNHNSKGNATYGNYVKVKQTNGKTALYAHLKYNSIKSAISFSSSTMSIFSFILMPSFRFHYTWAHRAKY